MKTKTLVLVFFQLVALRASHGRAATCCLYVPTELNVMTDGNSRSSLPFDYRTNSDIYQGPVHYQQVYAASQFTNVAPGGAFLVDIAFQQDCSNRYGGRNTNIQVRVSTSLKTPDQLSPIFSQNIGSDELLVLSTNLYTFGEDCDACSKRCPTARGVSDFLIFTTPFFYIPSRGSLLVDIQHTGFSTTHGPEVLGPMFADTQNVAADGVSRVAALSLTASTAEFVDTEGAVTYFEFAPVPSLSVELQGTSLEILWPTQPKPFRLQWAAKLGTSAAWQNYPGSIHETFLERDVQIPLDSASLKTPKFFRLFWNSPQPGTPGSAIQALGSENSTPSN